MSYSSALLYYKGYHAVQVKIWVRLCPSHASTSCSVRGQSCPGKAAGGEGLYCHSGMCIIGPSCVTINAMPWA